MRWRKIPGASVFGKVWMDRKESLNIVISDLPAARAGWTQRTRPASEERKKDILPVVCGRRAKVTPLDTISLRADILLESAARFSYWNFLTWKCTHHQLTWYFYAVLCVCDCGKEIRLNIIPALDTTTSCSYTNEHECPLCIKVPVSQSMNKCREIRQSAPDGLDRVSSAQSWWRGWFNPVRKMLSKTVSFLAAGSLSLLSLFRTTIK